MHVQEGDYVKAGDRLTRVRLNPHDTLKIKGIQAVQEYWSTRSGSTGSRASG